MRGGLSFYKVGYDAATFEANTGLKAVVAASGRDFVHDKAVVLAEDQKVGLGSLGDVLFGKIEQYETDGYVTVQYRGFAYFPQVSGSVPTPHPSAIAVVNGSGAVLVSTGGEGRNQIIGLDDDDNEVIVLLG